MLTCVCLYEELIQTYIYPEREASGYGLIEEALLYHAFIVIIIDHLLEFT